MTERLETPLAPPQVSLKIPPGTVLILQLLFCSQTTETMLLRPTLDDWVLNESHIISAVSRINPTYVYLFEGGEATQTITLQIPLDLQPGQILKSWLRFPGVQEEAISINVEIAFLVQQQDRPQIVKFPLRVTFPLCTTGTETLPNAADKSAAGIFGLLSGLIDLDKIPSSWLVAELLVRLCQKGDEYARTEPGSQLLSQLSRTDFFKNGAIAFAKARVPNWIENNLSTASAVLGGQKGQGHLLYIWERWLWSLAAPDLAAGGIGSEIWVPPFLAQTFVAKLGESASSWFALVVLGLVLVSPAIAAVVKAIATHSPPASTLSDNLAAEAGYSLATGLPELDALPVRWLVVELLLILCQTGDDCARTQAGRQLLNRLDRTRFFKNGVLALASAQAPRWLTISQSAAAAFHSSPVGVQNWQGGLLYTWEQWLWSLVPDAVKAGVKIQSLTISSGEALVAELNMDAERWFASSVLGLTLVSPHFAATVEAIAALAPAALVEIPLSKVVDDVIEEKGSIQR